MLDSECGGCQGIGRHRRWCPAVVGESASEVGTLAELAESLGDRIGSNDPGAANMAYRLSGRLRRQAEKLKTGDHP